ncbi:MAG: ABC transporter permease [Christensenellaceae bacterium]|jgi:simple sugar transport system permease protein|nr:ABC transporter permease [Christensenellaceae bacterium]
MKQIISLIQAGIVFGTVILFGATGETLTEKSGNLNLGVPGIMYLGGIAGLIGVFFYEMNTPVPNKLVCIAIALLCAFIVSMLGGLLFSLLTITLRANQNVTGLTLTIFAGGFANFFGGSLNKLAGGVGQISVAVTSAAFRTTIPGLSNALGSIGQILFSYGFMVYLAIAIAVALAWYINNTSVGLNLRAVGENPATADAAGIHVTKYKYLATCIGAGISGLGGLYYVMDYMKGTWDSDGGIERLGWLAVALVIFSSWKPKRGIWGSYLFGVLSWLYFYLPGLTRRSMELFKMLPYLVTVIVLIVVSLRHSRDNQPPTSLGLPYFREER